MQHMYGQIGTIIEIGNVKRLFDENVTEKTNVRITNVRLREIYKFSNCNLQ